jgi:hypothetical protein
VRRHVDGAGREVEDGDHHLHRVGRGLPRRAHEAVVEQEVDAVGPPLHGVRMGLAHVDVLLVRRELVDQGRVAERVQPGADLGA